ncbi:cellulase family glycosylhydrolase [Balneola sp. MJW-20]|uniref:cellulase family glycosylhydrolase n=1 Tax=Gracilimonas aurantiaca TaxID=3234185 RepID=UPI00390C2E6C
MTQQNNYLDKVLLRILLLLFIGILSYNLSYAQTDQFLKGVNLAGAEFGEGNLPGNYGSDYIYPTKEEVDYFMSKGMTVFRIGFRWERLQRSEFSPLNETELGRVNEIVNYATSKGAHVLLNPHNYSRYYGKVVGSSEVTSAAFADFWARVAEVYKNNPRVMFGLVNEPHDMSTEVWRDNAQAAIDGIRETGSTNLITVPGNGWTGAHSWFDNWYGSPNAEVMLTINDPADNMAYEVHQYLDSNYSGASQTCQSSTIGSEKLIDFTNWLRDNGKVGFLAEFGAAFNNTCMAAIEDMLDHVEENQDVWMAWAWWAAGPWWGDGYFLSIEPYSNGDDKPQMAVLENYLDGNVSTSAEDDDGIPDQTQLAQNYPNPFNPTTNISYTLPQNSDVTLTVYNMLGQPVAELVNARQSAGSYTASFDASGLSSGIYFYRLVAAGQSFTKQMLLVK